MHIPRLNWPSPRLTPRRCNRQLARRLYWLLILGIGFGLAGCSSLTSPRSVTSVQPEGVPKQLLNRQIIVTLAPGFAHQWDRLTTELAQAYQLPKVGAFPLRSIGVQCLVFQIPPTRSLPTLLAQLAADPRVETVQTNQFFQSQALTYNDPYGKFQHGIHAIHAALVHSTVTGKGVKVAVIDTGVDAEHPDLRGRITGTANFVAGGDVSFAADRHGTAIAGVIAAQADNSIGIFGVAPEADILALKACWHRSAT